MNDAARSMYCSQIFSSSYECSLFIVSMKYNAKHIGINNMINMYIMLNMMFDGELMIAIMNIGIEIINKAENKYEIIRCLKQISLIDFIIMLLLNFSLKAITMKLISKYKIIINRIRCLVNDLSNQMLTILDDAKKSSMLI